MLKRLSPGGMFCFSPPVMLASFIIELALALIVVWRYKLNRLARLVTALLMLLAVFQLAEYMVCGGLGVNGLDWSRLGFAAITLLPPLGLHILYELAGKQNKSLLLAAYGTAAAFVGYFLFATTAFEGNQCLGNYAIFLLPPVASWLYVAFYYGWLVVMVLLGIKFASSAKKAKQQSVLRLYLFGYAAFLLPTITISLVFPEVQNGIPSIMCGFAVLLALIVGLVVMPKAGKRKNLR